MVDNVVNLTQKKNDKTQTNNPYNDNYARKPLTYQQILQIQTLTLKLKEQTKHKKIMNPKSRFRKFFVYTLNKSSISNIQTT